MLLLYAVLPGRSQKVATRCQSATNAISGCVTGAAFVFGVVALGTAFDLIAPAGENRGVHIQGDGVELEFVKELAVAACLHSIGAALVESLEQAHDGFVTGCVAPVKQAHKRGIQTGDVSVGETGGTTPDAHEHLLK